jgi:two-component system, NarL family, invasion response regulator UvrY
MIKIMLADDHSIVREGLKRVLTAAADMSVVAEAVSCEEVLSKIASCQLDTVVLDISMPGGNGFDVLGKIKTIRPRLPVILFSMYSDSRYVMKARRLQAAGYLVKTDPAEEILLAIRRTACGRTYFSRAFEEVEIESIDEEDKTLSPREQEVLRLIGEGRKNQEIAQQLGLSHKTVSTYRARILEKLHLDSNSQLIHYMVREGSGVMH